MPDHNNIAAAEQLIVREIQRNRQLREEVERSAERLAGQQAPYITAVQTPTEQRTPRGSSYFADFEGSVPEYAVIVNQNRPIHADFESSYQYNIFLNSKYKHHHKCATCQKIFRCGQAKCDRTLCRICDLRNELSTATWTTDEVVILNFNGGTGRG